MSIFLFGFTVQLIIIVSKVQKTTILEILLIVCLCKCQYKEIINKIIDNKTENKIEHIYQN